MADFSSSPKTPNARVAVVAAGVVSPLGFGLSETSDALAAAKDCVTAVSQFPVEQCRCKTAGQVSDDRLPSSTNGRAKRLHRASHMLIRAVDQAFRTDPAFKPE